MPTIPATLKVRPACEGDIAAIVSLWDICDLSRPHNHGPTDIAFALRHQNSEVLVAEHGGQIVASALVGHDGHRGWVYYVAVHPQHQRQGIGRMMMGKAEEWLRAAGIWKMHLLVRSTNRPVVDFYAQLGFADDDVVVLSKPLRPMPYIEERAEV